MASTCSKCGAPIIWIKTERGKWMPADEGLPTGMARTPHWATCPYADDFRRRGGKDDG